MKKKIVFIYILFSIVFSGCFFQMPESVSIKTNATYNVRIGKFKEAKQSKNYRINYYLYYFSHFFVYTFWKISITYISFFNTYYSLYNCTYC